MVTFPRLLGVSDHTPDHWGPSTRAIHAGLPDPVQGEPLLPGPVLAAPYHLRGAADSAPYGYGRDANPTWTRLEAALGALDGGESVVFSSGMAAVSAVVLRLRPGDILVAPRDAYPGIRKLAESDLAPSGVEVRFVPSETGAIVEAAPGATLVWVETPSNPGLEVVDVRAVADATDGLLAVDNTVATPLGLRPLDLGADFAMVSGTKALTGHSDVLLGVVSTRDPAQAAELRAWRSRTGAVLGPFEAWLAHRSLATLGLRLERAQANARALVAALEGRDDVAGVRWPGIGPVLAFVLPSAERAQAFLDAAEPSPRPRASAGCTRPPSAVAAGGPTTCRRASSASARAARTPRTSSATCCAP